MKPRSRNLSDKSSSQQSAVSSQCRRGQPVRFVLCAVCCVLCAGLLGCESFQRKFVRKSKTPAQRPTPVIQFHDYTGSMTPVERYQKHYMLFDYWNSQLLGDLDGSTINVKRLRRNSKESLAEMETILSLLGDERAAWLEPIVKERRIFDRDVQRGLVTSYAANRAKRDLERQTRDFQRDFFWRDVQDELKPEVP